LKEKGKKKEVPKKRKEGKNSPSPPSSAPAEERGGRRKENLALPKKDLLSCKEKEKGKGKEIALIRKSCVYRVFPTTYQEGRRGKGESVDPEKLGKRKKKGGALTIFAATLSGEKGKKRRDPLYLKEKKEGGRESTCTNFSEEARKDKGEGKKKGGEKISVN